MLRALLLGILLAASAAASAQLYRWVDRDGRVHYTATPPPPGATKSRTLETPAAPAPPAAGGEPAAKDDARRGPLTPAEQEAEFRKRRLEAQKAAEKTALERQQEEARVANCQRARSALAAFESGQRIARTSPQGERYYLDDAARARETEAAHKAVQEWCN